MEPEVLDQISGFVAGGVPINFYLDVGGGYGAAVFLQDLCDGDLTKCLSFEPNCLHVLCLAQIARFAERIRRIYPPGIRMILVIDDLVSHYVNEIPRENTAAFCARLRALIERLGLQDLVGLLVESEVSPLTRHEAVCLEANQDVALSDRAYENVLRFSGRLLSREEAAHRMRLYCATCELSERYLAEAIDGVHLTQRKEAGTLSFRSFPGGCARIQAGRACFVRNSRTRMIPRLLTTSNVRHYRVLYVPLQSSPTWVFDSMSGAASGFFADQRN